MFLPSLPAQAQNAGTGVRVGVSSNPDQFVFGAHFDTGPIFDRVSFRPNVEIGVGDDRTTVSGNFEFAYWFAIPNFRWHVYAGGGPAIIYTKFSDSIGGGSDVGPGLNAIGGIAHPGGLFFELKLGLIRGHFHPDRFPDSRSAEAKFLVGYTWK